MKISFFETRTRNSFFQSRASRREREFLFSISCFETRTRNRKSFLMVEREKIKLILTRIPGIENPPNSGKWVLFFRTSKTTFCAYDRKLFDDDNDGCNDNYDDNYGNFDDDYDKND